MSNVRIPAAKVVQLLEAIEAGLKATNADNYPAWAKLNEARATVVVYLIGCMPPVEVEVTP